MVGKKYVSKDDLEAFARKLTRRVSGSSVHGGGGNGGGGATDCYWTKDGNDIYYDDGIVGIRTMTNDVRDAELQWAVGAADVTKYTMGVDDSDGDKWKLAVGDEFGDAHDTIVVTSGEGSTPGVAEFTLDQTYSVPGNFPWGVCSYGAYVYYVHYTGGGGADYIVKLDIATGIELARSAAPHAYLTYLATDGTYVYAMHDSTGIRKYACSDLAFVAESADYWPSGTGICYWSGHLYRSNLSSYYGNQGIRKTRCSDLTVIWTVNFAVGSGPNQMNLAMGIATEGTYLYVLDAFSGGNNRIVRLNMDGTWVDSTVIASTVRSLQMLWSSDTGLYYAIAGNSIEKRRFSDLALVDTFPAPYAYYQGCTAGDYHYISTYGNQSVLKFTSTSSEAAGASNLQVRLKDIYGLMFDVAIFTGGGRFGIGTTIPSETIEAIGNIKATAGQLISTIATGTAPMGVTSTTVVTNLNADLLDGNHAAAFAAAAHAHVQADITGLHVADSPTFAGLTLTGFSGVLWASGGVVYDGGILGDLADVYLPFGEPDVGDVLTYESGGWTSMPPVGHDLLSATHEDTDPGVVEEGDIIYGVSLLPGWLYCKRIDLPIPTANLTNFPVCIKINADAVIGAGCLANGYDIRFTAADGVTLLPYERKSFTVAGGAATGIFWVKTDVATAGTYIWCYYGNSLAADGENRTAVWDTNFKAVYHMKDLTTSSILDSTANNNDGTKTAANQPVEATGKVGKGQDFDGIDDFITCGSDNSLNIASDLTISHWIRLGSSQISKCTAGAYASGHAYELGISDSASNIIKFYTNGSGGENTLYSTATYNDGQYHLVVGTYDGAIKRLYVDGYQVNSVGYTGSLDVSGVVFNIGRLGTGGQYFVGCIDEVRVSPSTRSAAWIKFEYANMNPADGGLTWGAEETTARWTRLSKATAGPTFDHVHTNQIKTDEVAPADLTITTGAAKTLVLGTAVYKDINMAGYLLAKPASSAPGVDTFRSSGGVDTTIETYAFALNELVHGGFELQHDYKEATDLVFHVHWQGIAAPTGGTDNVQWRLNYIVARDGVTLAAATAIDSPDVAIDTQYRCYRTDFAAIVGTNFKIGDQFMFTLTRVAAVSDDYAGDCLIETAGIHYQVDTLGSRAVATK